VLAIWSTEVGPSTQRSRTPMTGDLGLGDGGVGRRRKRTIGGRGPGDEVAERGRGAGGVLQGEDGEERQDHLRRKLAPK
jgi:hypothetical protein